MQPVTGHSAPRSQARTRRAARDTVASAHLPPPSPEKEGVSKDWTQRRSGPGQPGPLTPTLRHRQANGSPARARRLASDTATCPGETPDFADPLTSTGGAG